MSPALLLGRAGPILADMADHLSQPEFLPLTRAEMDRLGWDQLDVLIVSGDAYVDHPAFGPALLGRWLVAHGFRVGLVTQPDWRSPADVARLGRPRLLAGVTAGALDSMLAHYTAFGRKRSDDAYTPGGRAAFPERGWHEGLATASAQAGLREGGAAPGGRAGARPNRASIVYANLVRQAFPGLPVVLGGLEASLRRVSHYDFWTDRLRRSILLEAKADLILYGMAERALLDLARRLDQLGPHPTKADLTGLPGTAWGGQASVPDGIEVINLPSHDEILARPALLIEATLALERQVHQGLWAVQASGDRTVVLAPPSPPLTTAELDRLYGLPFSRRAHPGYAEPVPAAAMLSASLTTHRGCGGGCAFCSLALHQGRRVTSRSRDSILAEARRLADDPEFKGSLSDVGGPSANMWGARCLAEGRPCRRVSCLHPRICRHFQVDQGDYVELLRALARLPGVKNVRVASGLRHDLALRDKAALAALIGEFVGGQLKVAPEHRAGPVLELMRKPAWAVFEEFLAFFETVSRQVGKEQYLVPYLMSCLPGCGESDMADLAAWLKARGWRPRQVQAFVPTPGTLATALHWAGVDPHGRAIAIARGEAQRRRQHHWLVPQEGAGQARPGPSRRRKITSRP